MNAAGGGSIITLTFAGGELVVPGYNIMGVAKAALDATVRYLAYDLGPENIRVNAISPGPVLTPSSMVIEDFGTVLQMIEERSPLLHNINVGGRWRSGRLPFIGSVPLCHRSSDQGGLRHEYHGAPYQGTPKT